MGARGNLDPVRGLLSSVEQEVLESWGGKRPPSRLLNPVGDALGELASYASGGKYSLTHEDSVDVFDLACKLYHAADRLMTYPLSAKPAQRVPRRRQHD
jgi:hypothetical protein